MSDAQWAVLGIGGAILVYPTWCAIKAVFWTVVLHLYPGQPDTLDEQAETYGPRALYGPVDLVEVVSWHTRKRTPSTVPVATSTPAAGTVTLDGALTDHVQCEGDECSRIICCCPLVAVGIVCLGTTEQACSHHQLLCDMCRLECTDCRIDFLDDAGVR